MRTATAQRTQRTESSVIDTARARLERFGAGRAVEGARERIEAQISETLGSIERVENLLRMAHQPGTTLSGRDGTDVTPDDLGRELARLHGALLEMLERFDRVEERG